MAGDGRRRLRRVSGRAADLGADLAGRRAPGGPGRRRPRPGGSDGRPRRHGTVRRRSPSVRRRARTPGSSFDAAQAAVEGGRPGSRRSCVACSCRGSCRRDDRGWWDPLAPSPARDARSRARPRDADGPRRVDAATWARLDARAVGRRAGRSAGGSRDRRGGPRRRRAGHGRGRRAGGRRARGLPGRWRAEELLALGVAPWHRRQASPALLAAHSPPIARHRRGHARRARRPRAAGSRGRLIARRLLARAGYRWIGRRGDPLGRPIARS